MTEAVTGTELKVRSFELPERDGFNSDQRVIMDGPSTGPNSVQGQRLVRDGVQKFSQQSIPTNGFPAGTRVPLVVNGFAGNYPLQDVLGNGQPLYLGPFNSPPVLNNAGLPLIPGNTYYNLVNQTEYIFNSALQWVPIGAGAPTTLKVYTYLPNIDVTILPVNGAGTADAYGNILSFDTSGISGAQTNVMITMNGVSLARELDYVLIEGTSGLGDSITLMRNVCAGSVVSVYVFARPEVNFSVSAVGINTSTWIFNGSSKTFPLKDFSTVDIVPGSTVNVLLSLSGLILNPFVDFNVAGASVTFAVAPQPGQVVWCVIGVPIAAGSSVEGRLEDLEARIAVLEAA